MTSGEMLEKIYGYISANFDGTPKIGNKIYSNSAGATAVSGTCESTKYTLVIIISPGTYEIKVDNIVKTLVSTGTVGSITPHIFFGILPAGNISIYIKGTSSIAACCVVYEIETIEYSDTGSLKTVSETINNLSVTKTTTTIYNQISATVQSETGFRLGTITIPVPYEKRDKIVSIIGDFIKSTKNYFVFDAINQTFTVTAKSISDNSTVGRLVRLTDGSNSSLFSFSKNSDVSKCDMVIPIYGSYSTVSGSITCVYIE